MIDTKTTYTANRGYVAHLHVKLASGQPYDAPVKLLTTPNRNGRRTVAWEQSSISGTRAGEALERDGLLVYALPGGGEVVA